MAKSTTFSVESPSKDDKPTSRSSNNNNKSSRSSNNGQHSSSGNINQDLQEQQNDLLDMLMKQHSKKSEEAAKQFGIEIENMFQSSTSDGENLALAATKTWDQSMKTLQKELASLNADSKEMQEAFEENRQNISSLFTALEEKGSGLNQPSDGNVEILESLPLVFGGRPKRLRDFRRKKVAAFKREEAELIEYKKTANGARLLTEAVKKSFG